MTEATRIISSPMRSSKWGRWWRVVAVRAVVAVVRVGEEEAAAAAHLGGEVVVEDGDV